MPNRDRAILLGGAAAITGVAWLYMLRMARSANMLGNIHSHATIDTGALYAMWAVMMVAMMLPSTLPFIFAFAAEQRRRQAQRLAVAPASVFTAGYFSVWTAFSAACAVLQQFLHRQALLSPMMTATSSSFAGLVLMAAGVYQFTPMKDACLRHCRSPLTFLLGEWKEGASGAFLMGAGHGLFCIGCCWLLMLLPFAAGVMNLLWMAGLTVFLLIEKAAPGGHWASRFCGALLVLAGAWIFITGFKP